MMDLIVGIVVFILIFVVAFSMTLVGKGGGNFYVLILIFAAIPLEQAATTAQFILFCASFTGMLVFSKFKAVPWKLAIPTGILVAVSAFLGGFLSHFFDETILKIIFALLLVASGIVMLIPYQYKAPDEISKRFGHLIISTEFAGEIDLDLRVVVPITLATGFFSGMLGVSGGSFLVPMLVLACGVPMKVSVTTVTPLVAISALMGFLGHAVQGSFDPILALPLAVVTVIGGLLGGKFALKSKPKYLKRLFAFTNIAVAILVLLKIFVL